MMNETEYDLRCQLAAVYRLVAHYKMTDLIFTHISLRIPDTDHHFLINPYGLLFEEITASSLVKIDLEGAKVEPSPHPVNPAGFVIHSAIHAAREDAHSVLHTHTRAGCAVAAQSEGLLPLSQVAMGHYGRIAYHDYEGVALSLDEQKRLVDDLGPHHAMILRNHGLLTVGQSAGEAFLRMFNLERACQIQVDALAGGRDLTIPAEAVALRTAAQFNGEDVGDDFREEAAPELAWAALMRQAERIAPDFRD
ncbi:class II aldolase/adducin family protein [Nocardioides maradonensis]